MSTLSVCILVQFLSPLCGSNSLVATTFNISLHNHEPPKAQRLLHLADIYHCYSHSCLPLYLAVFQGKFTPFSPPVTISSSTLDGAELERSAGYWQLWVLFLLCTFLLLSLSLSRCALLKNVTLKIVLKYTNKLAIPVFLLFF